MTGTFSYRRILAAGALGVLLTGGFASRAVAEDSVDRRLVAAAKAHDAESVRTLLAAGVNVDGAQADGTTALHWAAYWGDASLTSALLRAGARVDATNDLGVTPLYLASTQAEPATALTLLQAGANPNLTHLRGASPLMEAARTGRRDIADALLRHGASIDHRESTHDQTALMWAVVNHHADVVRLLLEGGADVAVRSRIRERKNFLRASRGGSYDPGAYDKHVKNGEIVTVNDGGYTALLFAAQQGDVASASLLLDAGADVNDTAPIGMSALVVAAYNKQPAVGRLLLERGARPNRAEAGYTALHAAILRGSPEFVAMLLRHGADPNARVTKASGARRQSADYAFGDTLVGATPAYLAAKFAEIAILDQLIAAGANTLLALPDGTTPLMAALETDRINSLTGQGLGEDRRDRNVFFRTYNTESPAEAEAHAVSLVTAMLRTGSDVNATNKAGDTALHAAAKAGMNQVIEILAAHGAQLSAKNRSGQTPLKVAGAPRENRGGDAFTGHTETAALLRRLGATE